MIRLAVAGAHTTIASSLCASCPFSPAGCCTAPPRLDWSDIGRIVALGGRDWLLAEIAAGRLVRGEAWLFIRRTKASPRPGAARIAKCTYHGPQGCRIPHDRRAATCNYYVCEDALACGGAEASRARDVHARLVATFSGWDAELQRRIETAWPGGPPFDAAFLDWLGAAFAEVSASRAVELG